MGPKRFGNVGRQSQYAQPADSIWFVFVLQRAQRCIGRFGFAFGPVPRHPTERRVATSIAEERGTGGVIIYKQTTPRTCGAPERRCPHFRPASKCSGCGAGPAFGDCFEAGRNVGETKLCRACGQQAVCEWRLLVSNSGSPFRSLSQRCVMSRLRAQSGGPSHRVWPQTVRACRSGCRRNASCERYVLQTRRALFR